MTALRLESTMLALGTLALGTLALGCDGARPGTLEYYSDPVQVTVPESVSAGEPVQIEVLTYGDGCVSFARTEVQQDEGLVEIVPYDDEHHPGPGEACPLILSSIDHSVEVTLETIGTTTVLVHGQREPGGDSMIVERTITVE